MMRTAGFALGPSFDESSCQEFVKSEKKKSRGVCGACGLHETQHLLELEQQSESEGDDTSMRLLAQVLCDLRNLRICVVNFAEWPASQVNLMMPNLISYLQDSLLSMEDVMDVIDMDQLLDAAQELVGYFEPASESNNVIE